MENIIQLTILFIQKKCGKPVDKYVEYDIVLIVLDLILHRLQVFRHMLFNVTISATTIFRLALLILVFAACALLINTSLLKLD